ncbi:MAG TPA: hypothetical protein VFK02_06435, partial [Kofleriaceae bacterium]|nr:hypothetical protein [Kofleriaceae bacterium]
AGADGVELVLGGSCPGAPELVAASGTTGDGCVEPAALAAVEQAISGLRQPPAAIAERRPVPFEPRRIVPPDAAVLDVAALRVADAAADPARVAELLAALAAPAEVVPRPPTPVTSAAAGPAGAAGHAGAAGAAGMTVTGSGGAAVTLELLPGRLVARPGEPIALRPAPGAWDLLVRPSRALRDLALWLEEPTTITEVQIDDVHYRRGATLDQWTRAPAGPGAPADARALEALVAQLAAPRALGFADAPVAIRHRLTLTITPPSGPPVAHVLALGAPARAGCPAQLDHDAILLPAGVCTQVAALAR